MPDHPWPNPAERHLVDLIDAAGSALFTFDAAGRLTGFNGTFARFFGLFAGRGPRVGDRPDDIMGERDAAFWNRLYRRTLSGERFVVDRVVPLPTGRVHFEVSFAPIAGKGEGAPVEGGIALARNVTDVRRLGDALRALVIGTAGVGQPFFEALVGQLVPLLEVEHAFVARVLPHDPRRLRVVAARGGSSVRPGDDFGIAGTPPEQVVRQAAPVHVCDVLGAFPGDLRMAQLSAREYMGVPLFDSSGRVLGVLSVVTGGELRDPALAQKLLTIFAGRAGAELERLDVEEQLRQSQKMSAIGTLAGGVAHDFNNLLTAINGYADLLVSDFDDRDPRRAAAIEIRRAGERAAGVTRQLLAFSSKQVLQPRRIDLADLITGGANMLRRLVGERIEIETRHAPNVPDVLADPAQIEQVLVNLVVNARDAMPDGGHLTLETDRMEIADPVNEGTTLGPGSYAVLRVHDTGVGMDDDTLGRIFEPFFTTKDRGKGVGLGLSTAYGIVRQSGGELVARSTPGGGATFTILLPAAPADAREPAAAEQRAVGGTEGVLVVEDEDSVRRLASAALRSAGYQVFEAGSEPEALWMAQHHADVIRLLLLDVVMPDTTGPELAQRLRGPLPEARVLFMSGYPGEAVAREGVLEDSGAFLQKPFSARELLDRVRATFDE